ncbi:MAG: type II toxin-antitoxin system RelE/ParE family toxin [Alphaproteobacteria bacterium]|nr:type II toxin-antitoxin system RelE/ParE family toxin [Alphaproteobacteria bacterium]
MTKVIYSKDAYKSLDKIPQNYRNKITQVIHNDLIANPLQNDILKNSPNLRRHKKNIGNYRIIYMIQDDGNIKIFLIGHRRDIYDKAKRKSVD